MPEMVPRETYERDLIAMAQSSAEARSALSRAATCIREARSKLTPGMRAGTAEACELLDQAGDRAYKFLNEWDPSKCAECGTDADNGTDHHPPLCERCVPVWYPPRGEDEGAERA